jgi:hypothetical protein
MKLYKLIGYDPEKDIYKNPKNGLIENLPDANFFISDKKKAKYEVFDEPENWAKYAVYLVGQFLGLKDYCSLRYEIYTRIQAICGSDYSKWDDLSMEQKGVALVWCNIAIVNARGMEFYISECGDKNIADTYISDYMNKSNEARKYRYYIALTIYGFACFGKAQALKVESNIRASFLNNTYIERGVMFKSEDGIDGLGDWIQGTNGYSTTGLKPLIVGGQISLANGMNADTFCNTLVAILNDGEY